MGDVKVNVDLSETVKAITRMEQVQGYKTGLAVAGTYLKGKIAVYPRESHRAEFASLKQQRAFFGNLKAGKIETPYKRGISSGSKKLGQSWNVSTSNNGFTVTVGTAASYAKLVQGGPEDQVRYHKTTGWKRVDEVATQDGPQAIAIVENHVKNMTEGQG